MELADQDAAGNYCLRSVLVCASSGFVGGRPGKSRFYDHPSLAEADSTKIFCEALRIAAEGELLAAILAIKRWKKMT